MADSAVPSRNRWILIAGFGGLLLLMAFVGIDSVRTLREIQKSNDEIREGFLSRTRALDQLRSDLYLSGTYVRDYLLEGEAGKAEAHRQSLMQVRNDMDSALSRQKTLLSPDELRPFHFLTQELASCWRMLEPVFQWSPTQRQAHGYAFLRDEVFPRRMAMLGIADEIARINEAQLMSGKAQVSEAFFGFRNRLIFTVGLTAGLGLLLAAFTIYRTLRLETEAQERYQEIATARAELKQLSARLVEAQENERRAISRELHDEVGQALSGVLVEMANLSVKIRTGDRDSIEAKASEVKKLVEDAVGAVRNMALLLRPSMLDDLGLAPALRWQAREISKRTGVRVKVAVEEVSDDLPEEHKTCIFRIVQEALHNCVQHAEAQTVTVTVRQQGDQVLLSIEDDGKGFNPQQERGLGLLGIEERVSHLGGALTLESGPGQGALVSISLPIAAHKVQAIS